MMDNSLERMLRGKLSRSMRAWPRCRCGTDMEISEALRDGVVLRCPHYPQHTRWHNRLIQELDFSDNEMRHIRASRLETTRLYDEPWIDAYFSNDSEGP